MLSGQDLHIQLDLNVVRAGPARTDTVDMNIVRAGPKGSARYESCQGRNYTYTARSECCQGRTCPLVEE